MMLASRVTAVTAALFLGSLALFGCAVQTSSAAAGAETEGDLEAAGDTLLPERTGSDGIVLFNRYLQRFVTYDVMTRSIQEQSDVANYLQYEFPTQSDLYTAGNSLTLGFSVVAVVDEALETVMEVDEGEGVFPVATDGSRTFFILVEYDRNGVEVHRQLARLDHGVLIPYLNATGLIGSGALLGDTLYYSSFVEATGDYVVHRLDARDSHSLPELVEEGLESGRLYVHDGKLYTADSTSIYNGEDVFDCADLCYFFDDEGILIRIHSNEQADLVLDVIDTATREIIGTSRDVIDFRVVEGGVIVYTPGRIDTIEVPR